MSSDYEARLQKLSDAVTRSEAAYTEAMNRQDAIMDEPFETPEEGTEISRRANEMDAEIYQLREALEEAEQDFNDALSEDEIEDEESDREALSLGDAKDIWISQGMDEDYTFGYTEEELRRAADLP